MSINRVYLTPTPHLLPFGDPNAELLVDNKPLSQWQDQAFAACGLQRIQEATPPLSSRARELPDFWKVSLLSS